MSNDGDADVTVPQADAADVRARFLDYLESELVGPTLGETEVIDDPPNRRYLTGILFAQPNNASGESESVGAEQLSDESDPQSYEGRSEAQALSSDDAIEATTRFLPSSLGVSFFTTTDSLNISLAAGHYETVEPFGSGKGEPGANGRTWKRSKTLSQIVTATDSLTRVLVLEGRGALDVRWRRRAGGSLITVTLSNAARESLVSVDRMWDDLLTQVQLSVELPPQSLLEYPSITSASFDDEEQELRLQYREHASYAVGHGAAPEWKFGANAVHVAAVAVPRVVVPGTVTDLSDHELIDPLAFDSVSMADPATDRTQICDALQSLVNAYENWSDSLEGTESAAQRILTRIAATRTRMHAGVAVLRSDDDAWLAFRLANQAMSIQYERSTSAFAGVRRSLDSPADLSAGNLNTPKGRPWRPFQIGFFLNLVGGLTDPAGADRDLVDLIWFPTGGGKTEAYLLVAAFEMFRRRLVDGNFGAGTAVLSRYTLSLLTAQQFQRAAGTVLACEMIRRSRADLGDVEFSIGLWVGDATTRNKFADARKLFRSVRENSEHEDVFILDRCSWCGTEIMPRFYTADDAAYGVTAKSDDFVLNCPRADCPFNQALPIHVVDEKIYREAPSFVLGTVDKFADLAWDGRGAAFFGKSGEFAPPSLIIQDEMHLLTGPLGTTMGVYEHAIEIASERDGRPPKVIASTATIRRAGEQVKSLFGRDVAVFPPAGVEESDSFFARKDTQGPGRLYVGLMPQGHTSDMAVVHVLAALLQAPIGLALRDADLDLYWTIVAYHSSLQELGRTMTIARDDVPLRLSGRFGDDARDLLGDEVEELTANVERSAQPRLLERLSKPVSTGDAISVLAATNMLSVGVDVPRLGVMLVNGQPKSTAEYIQASSRIGRSGPGLVISLFRSARPRDRSHFETFMSYHRALYRHVEPTSVTPYSRPSMRRSLHAALVILVRIRLGLRENVDAETAFPKHEVEILACVERLVAVVERVDRREAGAARIALTEFVDDWRERAATSALRYTDYSEIAGPRLLKDFGQAGDGVPTLRSMRNVDAQTPLRVRGRSRKKTGN